MPAAAKTCPACSGEILIKWGKTREGHQRHRCRGCGKTLSDTPVHPLAPMRLPMDRAVMVLSLLVEGMSIRSAERITGHHRDTIMKLLVLAGGRCEALLARTARGVEAKDVQVDEIWSYVRMKQRTKNRLGLSDAGVGDAYVFTAIDRDTKLALAWEMGKRNSQTADAFMEGLAKATAGRFQITTDGWAGFPEAISYHLGQET